MLLAIADGLSYAGLLFLISLGLTLICGVFGVIVPRPATMPVITPSRLGLP